MANSTLNNKSSSGGVTPASQREAYTSAEICTRSLTLSTTTSGADARAERVGPEAGCTRLHEGVLANQFQLVRHSVHLLGGELKANDETERRPELPGTASHNHHSGKNAGNLRSALRRIGR
jgi:hypothetical protein